MSGYPVTPDSMSYTLRNALPLADPDKLRSAGRALAEAGFAVLGREFGYFADQRDEQIARDQLREPIFEDLYYLIVQQSDTDSDIGTTLREYMEDLLQVLWGEGEDFSPKRPFGESGWQWCVYEALVREGYVRGDVDSDGDVTDADTAHADQIIKDFIHKLMRS